MSQEEESWKNRKSKEVTDFEKLGPWERLGLQKGAPIEEIKKAKKDLAKELLPSKEEKFKLAMEAVDFLTGKNKSPGSSYSWQQTRRPQEQRARPQTSPAEEPEGSRDFDSQVSSAYKRLYAQIRTRSPGWHSEMPLENKLRKRISDCEEITRSEELHTFSYIHPQVRTLDQLNEREDLVGTLRYLIEDDMRFETRTEKVKAALHTLEATVSKLAPAGEVAKMIGVAVVTIVCEKVLVAFNPGSYDKPNVSFPNPFNVDLHIWDDIKYVPATEKIKEVFGQIETAKTEFPELYPEIRKYGERALDFGYMEWALKEELENSDSEKLTRIENSIRELVLEDKTIEAKFLALVADRKAKIAK